VILHLVLARPGSSLMRHVVHDHEAATRLERLKDVRSPYTVPLRGRR
jgi:hypothetical protein